MTHPQPIDQDDLPVSGHVRVNANGMELVFVPAGHFEMGTRESIDGLVARFPQAPSAAREWFSREHPLHRVQLSRPFYLGRIPVTVGQFRAFINATGYRTQAEVEGTAHQWTQKDWLPVAGLNWRNPGFAQTDEHPVVCVSWNDAMAFCGWLSGKDGRAYGLPTEAQWEYACRAGATTLWNFGDDESRVGEHAWFCENSGGTTHPVGRKKPNAWGLCDMHGNMYEWCDDWFAADYYGVSPADDPQGPPGGEGRVLRGGCWLAVGNRCASRGSSAPGNRITVLGFRVLCTA